MRKFLVVGCGGSGGATIRFMMDQLRADLRAHGITELPPAWQFVHIDVPTAPEGPEGLGTVRDLGGRYRSVSSPGNAYTLVANNIEHSMLAKGALRGLLGWTPAPKETAAHVPVTNGAGQYRAVGRMLTLTDLADIRQEFARAWEQLQRPDAWGELVNRYPGSNDPSSPVVPVVIGSMAGGSGAAMFLDVCRLLGLLPGLQRSDLGVFLFTADVFASLPETQRTGIDGNALGAFGEIIAAQSRASDRADAELFSALGIPPEATNEAPFARIFPIGSAIGGDGAKFGDGTPTGVYRGLGRALAATVSSEQATEQYVKSKIENPTPPAIRRDMFGWGTDSAIFPWGSFGYASLSLGRDRYAEYASQRMARNAIDRLVAGHMNPRSTLPGEEQLGALVDAQWETYLQLLQLPRTTAEVKPWFTEVAFPKHVRDVEARRVTQEAVDALQAEAPGQAAGWVQSIQVRLPHFQVGAADKVREASYMWASGWASHLETTVQEEFLRAMTQKGIPYARTITHRLRAHLDGIIDELRRASGEGVGQPLEVDPQAQTTAASLKKAVVGAGHAVAELIARGYQTSAQKSLNREAARLAAEVLNSFANDVLGGLERASSHSLQNLQRARAEANAEAGLAQLATTVYGEWPQESEQVPARFDHADNEVLLTTARDFPGQFRADVVSSVPGASGVYESARDEMVSEIISGRWESAGGQRGEHVVLARKVAWRPAALPRDAVSKTPTPASQPAYDLVVSPKHVLDRSRAHLARTDQPFHRFSSQSIEDFLTEPSQPEAELAARADEFVKRFEETMRLARPLVGVSPAMVQAVHPQSSLIYEYSFSDIPLSPSAPVVARLRAMLESRPDLDASTASRFDKALKEHTSDNRIALFGSYPKYSPLVFSSLLDQINHRWSSAPEQALSDLWSWKRTRPLPASLAMGADEQRAMVAGWFLGRFLGTVVLPAHGRPEPAQVWDPASAQWLSFPARLLTPPTRFRGPDDWLPAVLESHSLAVVQCSNDVHLTALRPYKALRSTYDDSPDQAHGGSYGARSGARLLGAWLATGTWPGGRPSEVVDAAALSAPQVTAQERAEAARSFFKAVSDYVGTRYLTDGSGVGAFGERRVRIDSLRDLYEAPLFADVSELAHAALTELDTLVDQALVEAGETGGGTSDVFRPSF